MSGPEQGITLLPPQKSAGTDCKDTESKGTRERAPALT